MRLGMYHQDYIEFSSLCRSRPPNLGIGAALVGLGSGWTERGDISDICQDLSGGPKRRYLVGKHVTS